MGERESIVIVSACDRTIRTSAIVLRTDERFVYVEHLGVEKRFSRSSGFEVPVGGAWGALRLSGKDLRRLKL